MTPEEIRSIKKRLDDLQTDVIDTIDLLDAIFMELSKLSTEMGSRVIGYGWE